MNSQYKKLFTITPECLYYQVSIVAEINKQTISIIIPLFQCQGIMSDARQLMLSEIHNMVAVDRRCDRAAIALVAEKDAKDIKDKKLRACVSYLF